MTKLIITSNHRTFTVYDLETKQEIFIKEKDDNLDCVDMISKGRPSFRPFGVTSDDEFIYIASNEKLGVYDKKTYEFVKNLDVPLFINTHEILKVGDVLYVCNTSTDTIGIYNLKTGENKFLDVKEGVFVDNIVNDDDVYHRDSKHVNSLFYVDNKLYYCCHNRGKQLSEYYSFDTVTNQIEKISENGNSSHGVVVHENHLYSLGTRGRRLLRINLEDKELGRVRLSEVRVLFFRGLCYHNGKLLIGVSNDHVMKNSVIPNALIISFDLETLKTEVVLEVSGVPIINDFILVD